LQGELLALILIDPKRQWTVDELAERSSAPYPTVAAELRRLQATDLVRATAVGRSKLLRANEASTYLAPLTELVLMSFGPPLVVGEEFAAVERVDELYIYGSWAARFEGVDGPPPNDVDVLIIGTPDRDEVYEAAVRSTRRIGREVNTVQRTVKQWMTATDGFTQQLRASPMVAVYYPRSHAEMEQGE